VAKSAGKRKADKDGSENELEEIPRIKKTKKKTRNHQAPPAHEVIEVEDDSEPRVKRPPRPRLVTSNPARGPSSSAVTETTDRHPVLQNTTVCHLLVCVYILTHISQNQATSIQLGNTDIPSSPTLVSKPGSDVEAAGPSRPTNLPHAGSAADSTLPPPSPTPATGIPFQPFLAQESAVCQTATTTTPRPQESNQAQLSVNAILPRRQVGLICMSVRLAFCLMWMISSPIYCRFFHITRVYSISLA
jgi:hypothetical protein